MNNHDDEWWNPYKIGTLAWYNDQDALRREAYLAEKELERKRSEIEAERMQLEKERQQFEWMQLSPEEKTNRIIEHAKQEYIRIKNHDGLGRLCAMFSGCVFGAAAGYSAEGWGKLIGTPVFYFSVLFGAISLISIVTIAINKQRHPDLCAPDQTLVEVMTDIYRKSHSNWIHLALPRSALAEWKPLTVSLYTAAKYGFKIDNPECQEFYKMIRDDLVEKGLTADLDWASIHAPTRGAT